MNPIPKILRFTFILALLLSACSEAASSPMDAVTHTLSKRSITGLTINRDTLLVNQTIEMERNRVIVLITFQGTRPEMGPVTCTYTYEVIHQLFGWVSGNGGGDCRQDQPDQEVPDLEIGAGHFSGQRPQDPGYTQVYGRVNNAAIEMVRITWDDHQVTEVEPVNNTFFALRNRQFFLKKVEGLDGEGQLVWLRVLKSGENQENLLPNRFGNYQKCSKLCRLNPL